MSMFRRASLAVLVLVGLVSAGCQDKVHDENEALHRQNRELQAKLNEAETKLRAAPDPGTLQAKDAEIAARDAKIRDLEASLKAPAPGAAAGTAADPALAGIEAKFDPKAGTLTVNLPGDVLFDSGKAVVKPSAYSTLDKIIAAVKKDYSGKSIHINGYTDSDKISKSKDQWDDNWDLSYGRAKAVMLYLTAHGIAANQVAIVANGENKPKSTKPQSRRVEIVVSVR